MRASPALCHLTALQGSAGQEPECALIGLIHLATSYNKVARITKSSANVLGHRVDRIDLIAGRCGGSGYIRGVLRALKAGYQYDFWMGPQARKRLPVNVSWNVGYMEAG